MSATALDSRLRLLGLGVQVLGEYVQAHGGSLPARMIDGWLTWVSAWERFEGSPQMRSDAEVDAFQHQLVLWARQIDQRAVAGGAHVGFLQFISPSRARARMDAVNAEVRTLDEHIQGRRAQLGDPFVHAWERWRDSWRTFYGGYPREWDWWYLGNASAWNETLVFQERLSDWRESAERAGVPFQVPRPQTAPENRPSNSWMGGVRDIAIAGAVGAVALGAVYLVSRVA